MEDKKVKRSFKEQELEAMLPEEKLVLHTVLQDNTLSFPADFVEPLSLEDKMILYASLQDIAEELRRIHYERKKNQ